MVLYFTIEYGFIFASMESYFIGGIFLPTFNGPNEGIMLLASLPVISFIFGYLIFLMFEFLRHSILERIIIGRISLP